MCPASVRTPVHARVRWAHTALKALLPLPWGERKDVACFCPFAFIPWTPLPELSGTGHDGEFSITARFFVVWNDGDAPCSARGPARRRPAQRRFSQCPASGPRLGSTCRHAPLPPRPPPPLCSQTGAFPLPLLGRVLPPVLEIVPLHAPRESRRRRCPLCTRARHVPVCVAVPAPPARDRWAGRVPLLPLRVRSEDGDGWVTSPCPGARRREGVGGRSALEPPLLSPSLL